MMVFKDLVLYILPFIIMGAFIWVHVVGIVDFLKWYKKHKHEIDLDMDILNKHISGKEQE